MSEKFSYPVIYGDLTREETYVLIRREQGLKAVAKARGDDAAVGYHQSTILSLHARLG